MTRRRFAILDRDGTIIVERHYLSCPEAVELLPNAARGLRKLRKLGLGLVVATNQSPIGRGLFSERRLAIIHRRMNELLSAEGVVLDGIYVCPHTPDDRCACRKPATGLVERAAAELGFDAREGFVIGDKPCDIELGRRAGAIALLVRTGYGEQTERQCAATADFVVDDLFAAAQAIEAQLATAAAQRPQGAGCCGK